MATNQQIQQKLNEAGASPVLVVDGVFGPASRAAVMVFQRNHGLAVDGKAGPATLQALGLSGTSPAAATPAHVDPNNIHVKAKLATDAIPGITPAESAFIRSVAWHETNYGTGWGNTPPPNGGAGSFNMGAITTASPGPLDFQHKDSRNDTGQVVTYTTWFKGYPSFQAGMNGLAQQVLKPNVKAAIAKNAKNPAAALDAGVQGMYDNHYFLGIHPRNIASGNAANVADYFSAVSKAFATISSNTGEQWVAAGIGAGTAGLLGLLAWGAWKFFTRGA